jgi:hypothetical protein
VPGLRAALAGGPRSGHPQFPAVIVVRNVFERGDPPWIVMELFRDGSLAQMIDADPLPAWRVAQIGLEACRLGWPASHNDGVGCFT